MALCFRQRHSHITAPAYLYFVKYILQMKNDFFAHVFAVSGFLFFGGPMTAICVLYVLIGVKLKRSRLLQAIPRRCYDVSRGISAQTRVIRMLGKA